MAELKLEPGSCLLASSSPLCLEILFSAWGWGPALSPVLPQGRITPVFSSFWFSFPSILSSFQRPSSLLTSLGLSFFIFKMGTSILPLLSGLLSLQPLSLGLGQHSVFADTCKELYLMAKLASASPSGPNFFLNYPLNWL